MSEITLLETKIKQAAYDYYEGEPSISDQEFDALTERLKELDPTNPLLTKVGWGSDEISHLNDTKLPIKIQVSLPKIKFNNYDAIINWCSDAEIVKISYKLDGMSVIVTYEDGIRKSIISRGNGITGMELSNRLPESCFPKVLPNKVSATIRGEVFINNSVFEEKLSEDYANPRNATSGIVNSNQSDNKNCLTFLQHPQYNFIGLDTLMSYPLNDIHDSAKLISDIEMFYRAEKEMPHDGIVLDKYVGGKLVDSIAVKFPTEAVETTVKDISWQVSPRGRLIPVVEVEPVDLYGTVVKRATGLHYNYIVTNKIGAGARVRITKANEIIPQIVEVTQPATQEGMSSTLPKESYEVVGLHAMIKLDTVEDWSKVFTRNFLYNFLSFTGFKGNSISKFLESACIKDLHDFVDMVLAVRAGTDEANDYLKGLVPPSKLDELCKLLYNKIIYRYELLDYCGLDGVGNKQSEKLKDNQDFKDYLDMGPSIDVANELPVNRHVKELLSIPEVHQALYEVNYHLKELQIIRDDSSKPIEEIIKNDNPKVCLSGKFEGYTKKQLMEEFCAKWNIVDSLDKDCKYLVVPDLSRQSSKVTKAQNWGIPIIDFEEFKKKGGENNV